MRSDSVFVFFRVRGRLPREARPFDVIAEETERRECERSKEFRKFQRILATDSRLLCLFNPRWNSLFTDDHTFATRYRLELFHFDCSISRRRKLEAISLMEQTLNNRSFPCLSLVNPCNSHSIARLVRIDFNQKHFQLKTRARLVALMSIQAYTLF